MSLWAQKLLLDLMGEKMFIIEEVEFFNYV